MIRPSKKLVLETGQEFCGECFGASCNVMSEVIFNTSVVGYQEIISDPAYAGQIVVMTYPLIGNYGITDEDFESRSSFLGGLVVRECCDTPSNFRATQTLEENLEEHGIPCLSRIDTRMLTKIIRENGKVRGAIVDADMPTEKALELITATPAPSEQLQRVSCRKRWVARTPQHRFHVVVVDCGLKNSILSRLKERGCNVTVVPFNTAPEAILAFHPDGVLLSNGPVSGEEAPEVRALFAALKGKIPVMGIGLGMEIIGLEYGAKLVPMGCGIHGDHPVRDCATGRINVAVLNQSHRFDTVEGTSLIPTHTLVPEGSVAGFENKADQVFGVQFNPESAPGPLDNVNLFDKFITMMEDQRYA